MSGWFYTTFGQVSTVLEFGQSTLDVPSLQGADDVLIQVHTASLNPVDVKAMGGSQRALLSVPSPMKPGMDFAGVVVKKGELVDRIKVGDKVFGMVRGVRCILPFAIHFFCRSTPILSVLFGFWQLLPWTFKRCGTRIDCWQIFLMMELTQIVRGGSTCEYMLCDQHSVSVMPPGLSFIDAAALPMAGMTAMQSLLEGGLKYPPDEAAKSKSVFITGGPGGVGTMAIQLAKQMFNVGKVVTTASEKKMDLCKSLGADIVIDYTKQDFSTALGDERFDVLMDCTGDAWKMMSFAKPGGAVISILNAPTADILKRWKATNMGENPGLTLRAPINFAVTSLPSGVIDFFTGAFFYRLKGSQMNIKYQHIICIPIHDQTDAIGALVAQGKIRMVIDHVFPIEQGKEAYLRVDSGKAVGKVLVEIVKS